MRKKKARPDQAERGSEPGRRSPGALPHAQITTARRAKIAVQKSLSAATRVFAEIAPEAGAKQDVLAEHYG
jgi:hypothetical protein